MPYRRHGSLSMGWLSLILILFFIPNAFSFIGSIGLHAKISDNIYGSNRNSIQTSRGGLRSANNHERMNEDRNPFADSFNFEMSRRILLGNAIFLGYSFLPFRSRAFAEETPEAVCTNILGCPIPGGILSPPKKVYKDIFEEERDLARQAAEKAEQERAERRRSEILVVRAQFAVVKKGSGEMKKDMKSALVDVESSPENQAAWDDLRRFSRLYDTALRKDGMDLALKNIRRIKIQFDDKAGEAAANALTEALKGLDRAGRKKDVELSKAKFSEAVQAVESWLQFESQLASN
jgi:hypothetical protein